MEVFVEAEAKGGAAADQSHGQNKVGCSAKLRAQHAEAAGGLGCTLLFVLLLRLDLDRHSNLSITRNTAYY